MILQLLSCYSTKLTSSYDEFLLVQGFNRKIGSNYIERISKNRVNILSLDYFQLALLMLSFFIRPILPLLSYMIAIISLGNL